jgi:hypothetical protein
VSGAAAERALSARHRAAWPADLYAYDRDELRAQERLVLIEAPAGAPTAAVEYKPFDAGPLDLDAHQYVTLRASTNAALPALVVQFTHPEAGLPWAFKVHPNNEAAGRLLRGQSWTFTEQQYVSLFYVIQGGFVAPVAGGYRADPAAVADQRFVEEARLFVPGAGAPANIYPAVCEACGGKVPARAGVRLNKRQRWRVFHNRCAPGRSSGRVVGTAGGFDPAACFAHLDSVVPDVVWPSVRQPRAGWAVRYGAPNLHAVHRYLEEHGRPDETLADVLAFPVPDRPALGAFRSTGTPSDTGPAAAAAQNAIEAPLAAKAARSRLAPAEQYRQDLNNFQLARAYDRMWASERASDDNRDMWRR